MKGTGREATHHVEHRSDGSGTTEREPRAESCYESLQSSWKRGESHSACNYPLTPSGRVEQGGSCSQRAMHAICSAATMLAV